mgnify:CR=1 FL=1
MTNRPAYQEIHYGDCAHRPGMYSILVPGKRGRLFSVLYTAAGEGPIPPYCCFTASPAVSGTSTWPKFCVAEASM